MNLQVLQQLRIVFQSNKHISQKKSNAEGKTKKSRNWVSK